MNEKSKELRDRAIALVTEIKESQGVLFTDGHLVNEFAKLIYRQWPDIDTQNAMYQIMSIAPSAPVNNAPPSNKMIEWSPNKKKLAPASQDLSYLESSQSPQDQEESTAVDVVENEHDLEEIKKLDSNQLVEKFGSFEGVYKFAESIGAEKLEPTMSMLKLIAAIKNAIKKKSEEKTPSKD